MSAVMDLNFGVTEGKPEKLGARHWAAPFSARSFASGFLQTIPHDLALAIR
ncbi:hypothetical protein Q4519_21090 [Motilimonas sp. 1_MG-2023]|uniref:hypothetical protein n=1 Tax=Motilimonas sp. 1_MG-2023 TaxID=3062672 RepID=UPI0026E2A483|nr:hypothetical protein [Motilimonas sp. 1_MG-2023]MDO6528170.1 hypothetical protein [Motilimonas sp. 1_MG-2023]